ncbi:MAG: Gfo/Idh/MocA family oxidoreductase [Opitutaceae bacterium]|nr:Gfo/Idh/MocA family oxidoreductase [Opitutaceae bacterium]
MSAPPSRPRLALIGISGYGRIHLELARGCHDRGEAAIVAATVINPAEEAANVADLQARGCRIHGNYEEMLRAHRGEIDLCLIPTGIHWHARMTLAALDAGANVLVEKPLSSAMAEAGAVLARERSAGRFVAVGFQDCYDPGTRWLVDELRRGAIGEVRSVRFLGVWPRPRAYFLRNTWAGRLQQDGAPVLDSPLSNAFGHFVLLSLLFAGVDAADIAASAVEVELFRAHAIESFDTAVVALRTPRGQRLWFGASHASHVTTEPEILIEGSAGRACWRYEKEACIEPAAGARQCRPVLDQHATRRLMLAAVLARLRDPAAAVCTAAMAARHTALIETVHRAAPVTAFSAGEIVWSAAGTDSAQVPMVPGLDAALRTAYATQQSLRSGGFRAAV